ncbi:MAG: TMEM43 family protein [Candidatus Eremiobacteraeota bacterium]|nr:TMEM43 family protein [Candidatus Eremiobacteraeota bacterium]MCW5871004.1 TMEM43 family protein [Candidatus Eremiobacteraeota bacterium]
MSYTETTSEGFFSRLGNSIGGIFVGIILILASSALLYWNEGNYVRTAAGIAEGKGSVQEIKEDKVDASQDGKLIHVVGTTRAGSALNDQAFGVSAKALRLRRQVQFYEWQEKTEQKKRKKLGGGEETVTTYSYDKGWVSQHQDSSGYKEKGHDNPAPPDFRSQDFQSSDATLGAFKLHQSVLDKLDSFTRLPLANVHVPADKKFKLTHDMLYQGKDPAAPAIGDIKVDYQVVNPGQLSLVARQSGDSFEAYTTKNGTTILYVESGSHTADEMFKEAEASNSMFTWVLRFVGWLLMCVGFSMLVGPINIVADILPFFGDLVGLGTGLFGLSMGTSLSLVCIAVGWIFARPLVGILMLAGAIGIFVMLKKAGKK